MTLCIKPNNIDFKKITLNNKKKFNETSPVIYYPLNYNYEYNLNRKLYILTDWIEMDEFCYKYGSNKLYFSFINNDLDYVFNKIKNMIKINNSNGNDINDENKKSVKKSSKIEYSDFESDSDSEEEKPIKKGIKKSSKIEYSESETESESDSEDEKLVKKTIQDSDSEYNEPLKKPYIKHSSIDDLDKNYNDLIKLNPIINEINNEDEMEKYELNFNHKSSIKLIPSKKSGLNEYELNKIENYTEIKRYFPTINKKNTNFKIVGKFLLYINVFCMPNFPNTNYDTKNIKIHIKSGELKYEKTFVENDMLKSKGVYDIKIKIEI